MAQKYNDNSFINFLNIVFQKYNLNSKLQN